MKIVAALVLTFSISTAFAQEKVKMYFKNEDIVKIIEIYSKASGQKFVVDSNVRGTASIFLQEPVTVEEAFNHLSSALALNGFAISKQGDTMVIRSARNVQRDLIEVSTEKPSLKPERMYTWIYTVKNVPATDINRDLRILPSKDGEMNVNAATNQIIISDWASNLNRIAALMAEVDKKVDPAVAKLVEANKKQKEDFRKAKAEKAADKKD
ncbi:Type II secretion system protein D precursor [compost metagenome]